MNLLYLIGGLIALILLIYLFGALILAALDQRNIAELMSLTAIPEGVATTPIGPRRSCRCSGY